MSTSKIEWLADKSGKPGVTWNPISGCSPISHGCQNCYAARMAKRLAGRCGYPADDPFRVTLHQDKMNEPLLWKKPKRIFVCSMGDLFHDNVADSALDQIFQTIFTSMRHTFIVLTKRPERMLDYFNHFLWGKIPDNLWVGVTAENQEWADKRIPILMEVQAKVRFVSVEPMLGPVDLTPWLPHFLDFSYTTDPPRLDWVIVGGENGHRARPMNLEWVRLLRDQCVQAGTPFFFKGWGEWMPGDEKDRVDHFKVGKKRSGRMLDGKEWNEYPEGGS